MQFRRTFGGFHANRHGSQEAFQYDLLLDADHGIIGPRHPHIGLVSGPAGQNTRVGGRDVRVRSHQCGDTSIQIPPHRHLLTGDFRMKVHKANFNQRAERFQNLVDLAERAIRRRHIRPALQVDDGAFHAVSRFHFYHAGAGCAIRVIGRTQ